MQELSKIDVDEIPHDRVGFGTKLEVKNLDTGDAVTYTIVSGDYMDLEQGHISMASPLGRAFLGCERGAEVEVELPAGVRRFEIVDLLTLSQAVEEADT